MYRNAREKERKRHSEIVKKRHTCQEQEQETNLKLCRDDSE